MSLSLIGRYDYSGIRKGGVTIMPMSGWMFVFEMGLKNVQIASILGCSKSAVGKHKKLVSEITGLDEEYVKGKVK